MNGDTHLLFVGGGLNCLGKSPWQRLAICHCGPLSSRDADAARDFPFSFFAFLFIFPHFLFFKATASMQHHHSCAGARASSRGVTRLGRVRVFTCVSGGARWGRIGNRESEFVCVCVKVCVWGGLHAAPYVT